MYMCTRKLNSHNFFSTQTKYAQVCILRLVGHAYMDNFLGNPRPRFLSLDSISSVHMHAYKYTYM